LNPEAYISATFRVSLSPSGLMPSNMSPTTDSLHYVARFERWR